MDSAVERSLADVLRSSRLRLGITQGRTADLLGTRQSNVSAYEQGALLPGTDVAGRIRALANLATDSAYPRTSIGTLPAHAACLRKDLKAGRGPEVLIRRIIQASDDFASLTDTADRNLFLTRPATTGDRRYDALLAGLAVHLCRQAGLERTPDWTREPDRYLSRIWWFGAAEDIPALRARVLQESPSSMRARGVMFSARELESV